MKIYLAAPIFNPRQLEVVERLRAEAQIAGHSVFSPYHNSQSIWAGRAPKDCSPEERASVLEDNIRNIDWCDLMLAWVGGMGGFTDPGVVWELGYAYAREKFTLAYIDPEMDSERQSMNLMLAGTIDAVVLNQDELRDALDIRPLRGLHQIKENYPSDRLGQEKEPIV